MKRLPSHEQVRPVEFESLEARLLLNAAGLIQPDGPMPQTAQTDHTPAEQVDAAADVDGDGKLTLNDARTAGEPTSPTFNGRGIDLNEEEKVDALASADRCGYRPDSRDIDMLPIGKVLSSDDTAAVGASELSDPEWIPLYDGLNDEVRGVVLAYEPVWAVGTGKNATADEVESPGPRAVDLLSCGEPIAVVLNAAGPEDPAPGELPEGASRPIIEDILGSTEDFEASGAADAPVAPQERPMLEVVLGSTGDYQCASEGPDPILPRNCMCICHRNLIAQPMGLSPDTQPALGASGGASGMGGGIGKMLGQFA